MGSQSSNQVESKDSCSKYQIQRRWIAKWLRKNLLTLESKWKQFVRDSLGHYCMKGQREVHTTMSPVMSEETGNKDRMEAVQATTGKWMVYMAERRLAMDNAIN